MQPNELTLEAQMFDAKINSMDKTCLLAPLSFFDACNVSTDEERLRRMMLLRTRALQLGISEQEYADRRDNYTSQFDADPSYCLKIARMALRRQAMQELGFTPMADVETRQAEYLIEPYLPLDAIIGMYQAINPNVNGLLNCLLVFNLPFTFFKGMLDAVICFAIYKPLSPILHGRNSGGKSVTA